MNLRVLRAVTLMESKPSRFLLVPQDSKTDKQLRGGASIGNRNEDDKTPTVGSNGKRADPHVSSMLVQPSTRSTERESEVKTSPKRYKEVDWERVVEVLLLRAFHLYWTGERVIGATTANDLIQEVIQEFLNHPGGMGWEPKQGPLEKFLRIVLDRRWADPSFEDVETRLEPETKPENALADLERPSFLQAIRDRVKDYPDIEELLEAIEMLDDDDYDYANANQELAKLIGTSVKDIENRKKRLRRLLRDCEMKHDVNRWKRKQRRDLRAVIDRGHQAERDEETD